MYFLINCTYHVSDTVNVFDVYFTGFRKTQRKFDRNGGSASVLGSGKNISRVFISVCVALYLN